MMEDMFFIDFDPFARESRLMIIENGIRSFVDVSSDLNELPAQLIAYCAQYNQYKVKFHAPIGAFYELKRQIEKQEINTYGENKIELEVC